MGPKLLDSKIAKPNSQNIDNRGTKIAIKIYYYYYHLIIFIIKFYF